MASKSLEMITCRCCMATMNLTYLFEENLDQYFRQATGLVLSLDDGLSSSVCATCVNWLNGHNTFRLKCIETEAALRHSHQAIGKTINCINQPKEVNIDNEFDKSQTLGQTSETKEIIRSNLETSCSKSDNDENLYESVEGPVEPVEKQYAKNNKQLNKSGKKSKKLSKDYDPYVTLL